MSSDTYSISIGENGDWSRKMKPRQREAIKSRFRAEIQKAFRNNLEFFSGPDFLTLARDDKELHRRLNNRDKTHVPIPEKSHRKWINARLAEHNQKLRLPPEEQLALHPDPVQEGCCYFTDGAWGSCAIFKLNRGGKPWVVGKVPVRLRVEWSCALTFS